jgi:hypothetical protein
VVVAVALIPLALSIVAMLVSGGAAYAAWRARHLARDLASRYADAIALIILVARADPPVAHRDIVAACERLITAHKIVATCTSTSTGRIH